MLAGSASFLGGPYGLRCMHVTLEWGGGIPKGYVLWETVTHRGH
jgi:hypothetical protein